MQECGFFKTVFYVRSNNIQSFADANSSNITRLTTLMPMACQELVLGKEKEVGKKGRRKGKEFLVYWIRIRRKYGRLIKIL